MKGNVYTIAKLKWMIIIQSVIDNIKTSKDEGKTKTIWKTCLDISKKVKENFFTEAQILLIYFNFISYILLGGLYINAV